MTVRGGGEYLAVREKNSRAGGCGAGAGPEWMLEGIGWSRRGRKGWEREGGGRKAGGAQRCALSFTQTKRYTHLRVRVRCPPVSPPA